MTQIPPYSGPGAWPPQGPYFGNTPTVPPPTSGFAIASIIASTFGLATCCAFVPSLLGIVFAGVAWGPTARGEKRGRGMAVAGMIMGVLGVVAGFVVWIIAARIPAVDPVPGNRLTTEQRSELERLQVVQPGETIDLFYSYGLTSVGEGGVVITATHLVEYDETGPVESWPLDEIATVGFTPAAGFFDEATFILERDTGETLWIPILGQSGGTEFERVLTQKVTAARERAEKPPPDTRRLGADAVP